MQITEDQNQALKEFYAKEEPKVNWELLAQADNFRVERRRKKIQRYFEFIIALIIWFILCFLLSN